MIILKPIATNQEVVLFVRSEITACDAVLVEEETKDSTSYEVSGSYDSGAFTFNIAHAFLEGRFYWLKLNDSDTAQNLNKSKIFVTAQTDFENFDMNQDYYETITKDERTYIVKQ